MAKQRKVEKAWSIVDNDKEKVEKAKLALEKEKYRVVGVSVLPSEQNAMIIAERRLVP